MDPSSRIVVNNDVVNNIVNKAKGAASSEHTQGRIKQLNTRERKIVHDLATKGYLSDGLLTQGQYTKLCDKLDGTRVSKNEDAGVLDKGLTKYTRTLKGPILGLRISSSELIRELTKPEKGQKGA